MRTVDLEVVLFGSHFVGSVGVDEEGKLVKDTLINLTHGDELKHKYDDIAYYSGIPTSFTWGKLIEREVEEALYKGDESPYQRCELTHALALEDELTYAERRGAILSDLCEYSELEEESFYMHDGNMLRIRRYDSRIVRTFVSCGWNTHQEHYYCDECDCYIESDDDYAGNDTCCYCEEENHKIIERYSESHEHEPIFFGDYDDTFVGLGFELEVDSCDEDIRYLNEETAQGLCSASGLDYDEMRFAYDGSLNYGFECISQPHTIKAFWDKQENWAKMLKYLASKGYTSHDVGTCGLHVHVSRTMFGKTSEAQDTAIAKIYTFFDENWDEIVKVSRRRSFSYCEKNKLCYDDMYEIHEGKATKYTRWKNVAKKRRGGHDVALNNRNSTTFEYRLGRGTLNSWSFFSWIDFVLTLTKNAKRITVNKVESNDLVSWLGGITESTARYIYKRGAFKDTILALYPCIEWSGDYTDSND